MQRQLAAALGIEDATLTHHLLSAPAAHLTIPEDVEATGPGGGSGSLEGVPIRAWAALSCAVIVKRVDERTRSKTSFRGSLICFVDYASDLATHPCDAAAQPRLVGSPYLREQIMAVEACGIRVRRRTIAVLRSGQWDAGDSHRVEPCASSYPNRRRAGRRSENGHSHQRRGWLLDRPGGMLRIDVYTHYDGHATWETWATREGGRDRER